MNADIILQPFGPDGTPTTLGQLLVDELASDRFNDFLATVAFATSSGTSRVCHAIEALVARGGAARVVCGVANGVTSRQAVEHLLAAGATVTGVDAGGSLLFHQKLYRLQGPRSGLLLLGSNNLTADGLYRHFEAAAAFSLDPRIKPERELLGQADRLVEWLEDEYPDNLIDLGREDLQSLVNGSRLVDEAARLGQRAAAAGDREEASPEEIGETRASSGADVPPMSVPAPPPADSKYAPQRRPRQTLAVAPGDQALRQPPAAGPQPGREMPPKTLLIQIRPHHNGEIFLSKRAVDQDKDFFGWPFTGQTTPKKRSKNPPYPQRDPDPIVNFTVHDSAGGVKSRLDRFSLNTVYYSNKSEIRVTVPPSFAEGIPQDSILVMRPGTDVDYEMDTYPPGSDDFKSYLNRCDQKMPSGGSGVARRFGWV